MSSRRYYLYCNSLPEFNADTNNHTSENPADEVLTEGTTASSSSTSSKASINLNVYPDDSPSSIVIPKYTAFTSMVGSNTYTFTTDEGRTIFADSNGNYSTTGLDIYEGEVVTELYSFDTANTSQRFVLSNKDVDTSSLTINVTKSTSDFSNSTWTKAAGIAGMTLSLIHI